MFIFKIRLDIDNSKNIRQKKGNLEEKWNDSQKWDSQKWFMKSIHKNETQIYYSEKLQKNFHKNEIHKHDKHQDKKLQKSQKGCLKSKRWMMIKVVWW